MAGQKYGCISISDGVPIVSPDDWNYNISAYRNKVGVARSLDELNYLITQAGVNEVAITVIDTITLTANLTIASNINIVAQPSCLFTGAFTLTFNGGFHAGLYKVFDNNVTVVFGALSNNTKADWFENTAVGMAQLKASLDTEKTGSITFTSGKTYNTSDDFAFVSYDNLSIYGNGATLSVSSAVSVSLGYGIILTTCTNTHIENINIDGNRDLVDDIAAGDGASHGIYVNDGSDITIDRIYIYNMRSDGIFINDNATKISITNCKIEAARRNGLSVVEATDVVADKNYYLNNGNDVGLSVGISPKVGIDLEPNGTDINNNITISNSRFTGNVDDHIEIANSGATHNGIKIFGNIFDDVTGKTAIKTGSVVNNLDVLENVFNGRGFSTVGNFALTGLKIHDNYFNGEIALYLDSTAISNASIFNNVFYSADLTDTFVFCSIAGGDPQEVLFSGNTYYIGGDSLAADFDTCTFNACLMKDETFIRASGVSNSYRIQLYSANVKAENIQAYGSNIELYDETIVFGFDNIVRILASKQIEWYGNNAPSVGTFATGSKVYLKTPTAGGISYYSCTVAGTPGTWLFHNHDGETLQIDGINSDGGAFPFDTTGDVTFSNNVVIDSTKSLTVDTSTLVVNVPGYENKVGIGIATAEALAHISNTYITPTGGISSDTFLILSNNNTASGSINLSLLARSSGHNRINFGEQGDENRSYIDVEMSGGTEQMSFGIGTSTKVTLLANGNFGLGVTDPDSLLEVAGTAHIQGAVTMDSTLTVASDSTVVTFEDTNSAPSLLLYNSVATPGLDTNIGELTFRGKDDGGTASDYAKIAGYVTNDAAANEDGYMVFSTVYEGSLTTAITINPSSAVDFAFDVDIAGDLGTTGAVDIGGNLTIGSGAVGVDYVLTFDGQSSDGVITWMEDEDYFQYSDDILMLTTEKLYFRDTAISIHSNADGNLTIAADTRVTIDSDLTFNADGDDLIMGTGGTNTFSVSGGILTLSGSQPFIVDRKLTTTEGRIKNTTRITSADSPYTVLATDHSIFADTDGGAITVNLPAGVDGTEYQICNCGSSGNDVTVDGSTTETINGDLTQTLSDDEAINCIFESTEQWKIF